VAGTVGHDRDETMRLLHHAFEVGDVHRPLILAWRVHVKDDAGIVQAPPHFHVDAPVFRTVTVAQVGDDLRLLVLPLLFGLEVVVQEV
jgi:hypothetical protein